MFYLFYRFDPKDHQLMLMCQIRNVFTTTTTTIITYNNNNNNNNNNKNKSMKYVSVRDTKCNKDTWNDP